MSAESIALGANTNHAAMLRQARCSRRLYPRRPPMSTESTVLGTNTNHVAVLRQARRGRRLTPDALP
jgi:pyridoxine 5'-phosphate synthase PdxJ